MKSIKQCFAYFLAATTSFLALNAMDAPKVEASPWDEQNRTDLPWSEPEEDTATASPQGQRDMTGSAISGVVQFHPTVSSTPKKPPIAADEDVFNDTLRTPRPEVLLNVRLIPQLNLRLNLDYTHKSDENDGSIDNDLSTVRVENATLHFGNIFSGVEAGIFTAETSGYTWAHVDPLSRSLLTDTTSQLMLADIAGANGYWTIDHTDNIRTMIQAWLGRSFEELKPDADDNPSFVNKDNPDGKTAYPTAGDGVSGGARMDVMFRTAANPNATQVKVGADFNRAQAGDQLVERSDIDSAPSAQSRYGAHVDVTKPLVTGATNLSARAVAEAAILSPDQGDDALLLSLVGTVEGRIVPISDSCIALAFYVAGHIDKDLQGSGNAGAELGVAVDFCNTVEAGAAVGVNKRFDTESVAAQGSGNLRARF
ncbi:MAG: hypothetical protein OXT65_07795 [Alphaproteobacteria bacterium]|nr:hypothetical protein [Alphaproteobacteria bacterium]